MFFPLAGPAKMYGSPNDSYLYDCAVFCTLDQQIAGDIDASQLIAELRKEYTTDVSGMMLRVMGTEQYLNPVTASLSEITGREFVLEDKLQRNLWTRLD